MAIIVIRHLNKNINPNAMYRGGGSIGIIGQARAGMLVCRGEVDGEIILASIKSNLAPSPCSLTFKIVPSGWVSKVEWLGTSQLTANEALGEASMVTQAPARRPQSKRCWACWATLRTVGCGPRMSR